MAKMPINVFITDEDIRKRIIEALQGMIDELGDGGEEMPGTQRDVPTCNCEDVREAVAKALDMYNTSSVGSPWRCEKIVEAFLEIAAHLRESNDDDPDEKSRVLLEAERECGLMIRRMLQRIGNMACDDPIVDSKPQTREVPVFRLLHCDDCSHWAFAGIKTESYALPQLFGICLQHYRTRPVGSCACDRFDKSTDSGMGSGGSSLTDEGWCKTCSTTWHTNRKYPDSLIHQCRKEETP